MPAVREIRDPVHGFIALTANDCDIVDAAVFQRLRRVRQLAMAYLVYPGAVHTRFEHTLGVRHVSGQMCARLGVDAEHSRLITTAALLHDLGHGPFSHASELALEELGSAHPSTAAGERDKIHEIVTRRIINIDPELSRLISGKDRERIVQLLDDHLDQPIYRSIISGPIDADKQDYLLRDSYYCGVQYGKYDIGRLHGVLARQSDSSGDIVYIQEDGLNTIEQFVLARYFETTQVIQHRVRMITDAMLLRGLVLGVRVDRLEFLERLYTFEDTDEFARNYVNWNDERLLSAMLEPEREATLAGRFFRWLADRKLFKQLAKVPLALISTEAAMNPSKVRAVKANVEAEIASRLSSIQKSEVRKEFVIVDVPKPPSPRKNEGSLLIMNGGQLVPLESRSVIFGSINEKLNEQYVQCYAPLQIDDESRRRKAEDDIRELLTSAIARQVGGQARLPIEPAEKSL